MSVSRDFEECFSSGSGGIRRTCACGITWFDGSSPEYFDSGELEGLRLKASNNARSFREVDYTVSTLSIGDNEIVIGCTCAIAENHEQFLIKNSLKIANYLNKRAAKLKQLSEDIKVNL